MPVTLGGLTFNRTFQELAEFTRFEPGLEKSSEIKRNAKFGQFENEMRRAMAAHKVPLLSIALKCLREIL